MRVSVRISSKSLRNHGIFVGRSGAGKSKALEVIGYELQRATQARKNASIVIADPHGDLAKAALSFSHNLDRSRLVYISSTINREAGTSETYSASLNPFENDGSPETRFLLTEVLTDTLAELLAEAALSVQMFSLLRPAIATVLRSPEPSLATLNRLFLDKDNDDLIALGRTSDVLQHRQFWQHDWHAVEYSLTKRSIRSRLNYLLSNEVLAHFLQGHSTFSLEQALDDGKVIICNFSKSASSFTSQVMSKLLLAMIQAIMIKRDAKELKHRKSCYLILDEVQTMLSTSLASSLAESRKYGLSVLMGTQSVKAIDNLVIRKQIMVNTGFKCVGMTDYEDRMAFAREMGIDVEALEALNALQFYMKRSDGKHTAFKFTVPILSGVFLSKREVKELLHWLVYESGQYRLVPPPPPPTLQPDVTEKGTPTQKKSKPINNKSDEGLKPAF